MYWHADYMLVLELGEKELAQEIHQQGWRPTQLQAVTIAEELANALAHGTPGTPVRVRATVHGGIFELDVANAGEPIPPAVMERLFQPYFRGGMAQRQQGLGLGLFIAAAIAKAHGGSLGAESTPEETCFRFRMPTDTPA